MNKNTESWKKLWLGNQHLGERKFALKIYKVCLDWKGDNDNIVLDRIRSMCEQKIDEDYTDET